MAFPYSGCSSKKKNWSYFHHGFLYTHTGFYIHIYIQTALYMCTCLHIYILEIEGKQK